jgi:hypothetical protein
MKRTTIATVLLLILTIINPLISQDDQVKNYKNAFTFNITRLALLEARFGYERSLSEQHKLRLTLGLQFPVSSESFKSIGSLADVPYYYMVSKGIYVSAGYIFMFSKKSRFYISPEIYYNYNYYNNKYYRFAAGTDHDSYISLQSMNLKKSGLKILIGKKISLSPKKTTRLQLDFFGGIGIQYRQEELTTYEKDMGTSYMSDYNDPIIYNPPLQENSNNWYPTLHGGLLISLPF